MYQFQPGGHDQANGLRQKQEEYRLELERQIQMDKDKKLKFKEDQATYEKAHDMDMASYLNQRGGGGAPTANFGHQEQLPTSIHD